MTCLDTGCLDTKALLSSSKVGLYTSVISHSRVSPLLPLLRTVKPTLIVSLDSVHQFSTDERQSASLPTEDMIVYIVMHYSYKACRLL